MTDYYPPAGFHFKVEFSLESVSGDDREVRFQDVTGLKKELRVEEYIEGGENRYAHRFPQPARYQNLVLKRGLLVNSKLIEWCFNAIDHFVFDPTEITVSLLDGEHNTIVTWNVVGAYPVKWSASDLKAQENAIVVENMEIAYQYFTKKDTA